MVVMSAMEASNDIDSLWDKAYEQPVMIERAGKPIAVVLSIEAYNRLATPQSPRQFGGGRHLLSGAKVDVNELLDTPIDNLFSEYIPDNSVTATKVEVATDQLVLRRARKPREGWEKHFKQIAEDGEDKLLDAEFLNPTQWDLTEWDW